MISAQNLAWNNLKNAGTLATDVSNSASGQTFIDTLGCKAVSIFYRIHPGTAATAATHKMNYLAVWEGDTTVMSNGAVIAQFNGTTNSVTSTSNGFLISAGNSGTGLVYKFDVTCGAPRKRYLFVNQTPGLATDVVSAYAVKDRLENTPDNATGAAVSVLVVG